MGARMTNGTCPGFEDVMMMMPDANDTCPADQCIIDQNGECGHPPLTMHAYIVPVILALITLIGLVGNSIVVFVIFYQGQLKTVTNYYIVNLAITDLAFLIACAPFTAALYATKDWMFGRFMCKFVFYLQQVTAQSTCITLTAMSVDRYHAIVHPLKSLKTRTRHIAVMASCCIWTFSALLSIPVAVFFDVTEDEICQTQVFFCTEMWPEKVNNILKQCYLVYSTMVVYIIPLSIITVCYAVVLRRLWKSVSPTEESIHAPAHIRIEIQKRKVTRMVLAVILAFAICWLPLHAMNFWIRFDPCFASYHTNDAVLAFYAFAQGLAYFNSCVNPFVYAFMGGNFRRNLYQMLGRKSGRKPSSTCLSHDGRNHDAQTSLLRTRTTQV
ncbi:G-protein coupled receptor 54-like [Amphiura filiformis]|uniref:G-protein coupled receptor 54-like n=1 Tax=Amphiura filiformis TaxID=82378 RepID=UPI003B20F0E4